MRDLRPEHRLVVYGTLAPGRENEHVLASIPGLWRKATVRGTRIDVVSSGEAAGYPGLTLDDGDEVTCMLFESEELPRHWARLDAFEGPGYRRVTTSVVIAGGLREAYVYELSGR